MENFARVSYAKEASGHWRLGPRNRCNNAGPEEVFPRSCRISACNARAHCRPAYNGRQAAHFRGIRSIILPWDSRAIRRTVSKVLTNSTCVSARRVCGSPSRDSSAICTSKIFGAQALELERKKSAGDVIHWPHNPKPSRHRERRTANKNTSSAAPFLSGFSPFAGNSRRPTRNGRKRSFSRGTPRRLTNRRVFSRAFFSSVTTRAAWKLGYITTAGFVVSFAQFGAVSEPKQCEVKIYVNEDRLYKHWLKCNVLRICKNVYVSMKISVTLTFPNCIGLMNNVWTHRGTCLNLLLKQGDRNITNILQ